MSLFVFFRNPFQEIPNIDLQGGTDLIQGLPVEHFSPIMVELPHSVEGQSRFLGKIFLGDPSFSQDT